MSTVMRDIDDDVEDQKQEAPEQEAGLDLDLLPQEMPVRLRDPNTREVKVYTLREPVGRERDAYLNTLTPRMRVTESGKAAGIKNMTDLQATLISKCLFDEQGKQVSVKTLGGWPASVQQKLFEHCQKLCGLGDKAEDEAKND